MNLTERLSNFVVQSRFEDFPEEVIETGKKCLLDWIGVAMGGMKDPSVEMVVDLMKEMGGKKQASVLGYGFKTTILNVALINGMMSHVLDYDDAHSESRSHPSAPLLPALLAISEYKKLKGKDLITAFVIGFEVSTRIGLALGKTYYERGWHATSVLGRFGSAVGVGKLLGLNQKQLACAIGLAATQAGGLRRVFGTMGKPFHAGKASMDGMLSALLALRGFDAPEDLLDGTSGFLQLFSPEYDPAQITQGLGKDFQIQQNSFKPYDACLLIHPVIDGLIWMRGKHGLELDSVEQIDLDISPLCLTVTDKKDPKNGLEGKFSLYFCAALALLEGKVQESQFTPKKMKDHRIRNLMKKIRASGNDSLKESEAKIAIQLKNGTRLNRTVSTPRGDPRNPMSFDDIVEKFRDLTHPILFVHQRSKIIHIVKNLERMENPSTLLKLCRVKRIETNSTNGSE
jgi:2-methylcitrate dehydratase PrpD